MDQSAHLDQFGLKQPYKPKVVVTQPWYKRLFSSKASHVYGYKEYEEYLAQLKKCDDLVKFCGKNYYFKPVDWKDNSIDWGKELKELVTLAERLVALKRKK